MHDEPVVVMRRNISGERKFHRGVRTGTNVLLTSEACNLDEAYVEEMTELPEDYEPSELCARCYG